MFFWRVKIEVLEGDLCISEEEAFMRKIREWRGRNVLALLAVKGRSWP